MHMKALHFFSFFPSLFQRCISCWNRCSLSWLVVSVAVINIPWLDLSWPYKVFRLAFPIVAEEKMENTSTPAISWLFLWLIDWRQRLTSNLTLNPDSLQWQQNQNRSDTGRLQLQLSQRDQSQKLRNFNNSQKETFPKGGRRRVERL